MHELGIKYQWFRNGVVFAEGRQLSVVYIHEPGLYKCNFVTDSGKCEHSDEVEAIEETHDNRNYHERQLPSDGENKHKKDLYLKLPTYGNFNETLQKPWYFIDSRKF